LPGVSGDVTATKNMKSRVKGDFHARFCGKAGVKFLCLTRFGAIKDKKNAAVLGLLGLKIFYDLAIMNDTFTNISFGLL
jgi:hypothetical protein